MRAVFFREDGMSAIVGRLVSPNEMVYEDNGHLRKFVLFGNVVDTEYNDVVVLGQRIGEEKLEVKKMESLPHKGDGMLGLKIEKSDEADEAYCVAIPADISEIEERRSENGSIYHCLHAILSPNSSIYLNIFGSFEEHPANECFVVFLKGALGRKDAERGSGYAVKKQTTWSGSGWQVAS